MVKCNINCLGFSGKNGWMDGYFVYRRSTLKGHIASNKFYVMMILFNEKFKNI